MLGSIDVKKYLNKIRPRREDAVKLTQYLFFSSLSICAGYFVNNQGADIRSMLIIATVLPSLYIFNFIYCVLCEDFDKYVLSRITWIVPENRTSIVQGHSIVFGVIFSYAFCSYIFKGRPELYHNQVALAIISIYTFLFLVHRSLREIDKHLIKPSGYKIVSFLSYKSYQHAHVFAGSVIAIPFFFGTSLRSGDVLRASTVGNIGFSYILFLWAWIVLVQKKYHEERFLKSYQYILTTSLYPLFPIMFFLLYYPDFIYFYAFFALSLFLYALPFVRYKFGSKPIVNKIISEKNLMLVVLGVLATALYNYEPTGDSKEQLSEFGVAIIGIIAFIPVVINFYSKADTLNEKYLIAYSIMPYVVLTATNFFLWFYCRGFSATDKYNYFVSLSNHLHSIEIAYVGLWVFGFSYYIFTHKNRIQIT